LTEISWLDREPLRRRIKDCELIGGTRIELMEIVNFFETLAGKWFSQRTTHYLTHQSSQAGQSNLLIDFLPHTNASLARICEQFGHDASQIACGLHIHQDSRLDGDTQNTKQSTLMVVLNPDESGQGVLMQSTPSMTPTLGHYLLENEVLSINTETSEGHIEERLWFVNPNLRMRTSVFKTGDEVQVASFCSEIRMGLA
jgi:hypothetical protein